MRTSHVVTAEISLGRQAYGRPEAASEFFGRLETGLRALPGVTGVALADSLPPAGGEHAHPFFKMQAEGRPPVEKGTGGMVAWRIVTPGYFRMLDIPILEGRGFLAGDRDPQADAIVLSKSLAARLFPGQNPIGRHIRLSPPSGPWYEIVGVAGDVKNAGLVRPSAPEYYLARKDMPDLGLGRAISSDELRHAFFLVSSPSAASVLERLVRAEVASLDPTLPVTISTLDARVAGLRVHPRFDAALIGLFAALGLVLAAVGLYGVLSFLVTGKTQEIGVRMAMGAVPAGLLWMVVWRGLRLVLLGLVPGVALALAATRVLQGLLYGVGPGDPKILAAASLLLLFSALAACYFPARRAARVDPAAALRNE
jgi:putative ABC transport system permease protein